MKKRLNAEQKLILEKATQTDAEYQSLCTNATAHRWKIARKINMTKYYWINYKCAKCDKYLKG